MRVGQNSALNRKTSGVLPLGNFHWFLYTADLTLTCITPYLSNFALSKNAVPNCV